MIRVFTRKKKPELSLTDQFELAIASASVHGWTKMEIIFSKYGLKPKIRLNKKKFVNLFTFTSHQLLSYFQSHPDQCLQLLIDCGDKRYSPSPFISFTNNNYEVGMYDKGSSEVQIFSTLENAATDYVLFSIGLPRLIS
jgi:hypothetical protein